MFVGISYLSIDTYIYIYICLSLSIYNVYTYMHIILYILNYVYIPDTIYIYVYNTIYILKYVYNTMLLYIEHLTLAFESNQPPLVGSRTHLFRETTLYLQKTTALAQTNMAADD